MQQSVNSPLNSTPLGAALTACSASRFMLSCTRNRCTKGRLAGSAAYLAASYVLSSVSSSLRKPRVLAASNPALRKADEVYINGSLKSANSSCSSGSDCGLKLR
jgi:hypothetical protein